MDSWKLEDVSICTAVMNRTRYLREALSTWLETPVREIVIVDWGSRIPIMPSRLPSDPRIRVYRTEIDQEDQQWIAPIAMGAAVRLTTSKVVAKFDSDIKIVGPLPTSIDVPGGFYRGDGLMKGDMRGTYGTWMAPRSYYDEVNGYNERFRGWGHEDTDLYSRMEAVGHKKVWFPTEVIWHIPHDKTIRAKGQIIQNSRIHRENPWTHDDAPTSLDRFVPVS